MVAIHILLDNISEDSSLLYEHGLSLYIEKGRSKLLFDTGQSGAFLRNAKNMGIDISLVNSLVLSHGHCDHTGGTKSFLEQNSEAKIILKPEALQPKYKQKKYIGIPLETKIPTDRMELVNGLYELGDSIYAIANIVINHHDDTKYTNFYTEKEGELSPDYFDDELFLLIDKPEGLLVITACSHNGVMNIIETAESHFRKKVVQLVGGFHLSSASKDRVLRLSSYLNETQIEQIFTGHCTGFENYQMLKKQFRGEMSYTYAGNILIL